MKRKIVVAALAFAVAGVLFAGEIETIPQAADSAASASYKPDKDGFVQVVFVVEDDKVTAVQVETGIQSETHIEILSGIDENDEIVTGNYRAISQILKNDMKIHVDNNGSKEQAYASR